MARAQELLAAVGVADPDDIDCLVAVVAGLVAAQTSNDPGGDRWIRHLDRMIDLHLDGARTKERPMIQHLDHDGVSAHVRARPEKVYGIVADVTRTPEISPEILDCKWLDGATGPAVGARFKARNKVPNRPAWHNKPVVTAVEPGRRFAWPAPSPSPAPSSGSTASSPRATAPW